VRLLQVCVPASLNLTVGNNATYKFRSLETFADNTQLMFYLYNTPGKV
jgi:hypothetical protein